MCIEKSAPVVHVEGQHPPFLADHHDGLIAGDCETKFIPDVWVIGCDLRQTHDRPANLFVQRVNRDLSTGVRTALARQP